MSAAPEAAETPAPAEAELEPEHKPQAVGGLSDTVFGLAITLLGASLAISPTSSLGQILQQLGGFASAFFIIALVWMRRHRLLRWMRHEPLNFTRVNFVLLFLVISYTYILRLLTLSTTSHSVLLTFALFAILTALVNSALALLYHLALRDGVVMSRFEPQARQIRADLLITSAAFLLAAALIFVDWRLAVVVVIALLASRVILRQVRRWRKRKAARA
jgi:uncharacterized membrane protein